MIISREQKATGPTDMQGSWIEHINSYSEFDDSAVMSQDSLDLVSGRPESPLRFDHEEVLRIDPERDVCTGQRCVVVVVGCLSVHFASERALHVPRLVWHPEGQSI